MYNVMAAQEFPLSEHNELNIAQIGNSHALLDMEPFGRADRVCRTDQYPKDFSHADSLEWAWVDICDCLENTLSIIRHELQHKAKVRREYGAQPWIRCNPGQLYQVCMHLLLHAVQATEDTGTITVRTWLEADKAGIVVSDTGRGIPVIISDRIVEPFVITRQMGKRISPGLAMACDIVVNRCGGSLTVENEPGAGTTITVIMPMKAS